MGATRSTAPALALPGGARDVGGYDISLLAEAGVTQPRPIGN